MANRKQFAQGDIVVDVLNNWLEDRPDLNLTEIAERIGVDKSKNCFMSQIRAGRSKLPVSKIIPLAQVLEQDPKPMVVAVLESYYPELKDALIRSHMIAADADDSIADLRDLAPRQQNAI